MNAVDTNLLIYRLDRTEPVKRARARHLLQTLRSSSDKTVLPWQVLGEFARWLKSQQAAGRYTAQQIKTYLARYRSFFPVVMPIPVVLDRALDLADQHSLSHWDSMLVAACLEAGVDTLHTEDMGSPRVIESLQLENPFL
jgi:predicted nucleic acid-binding protein